MGQPISANLAKCGYQVAAYDVDATRLQKVDNVTACTSLVALADQAHTILLSLPDLTAVDRVIRQLHDISKDHPIKIIDTSTVGPNGCAEIVKNIAGHSIAYLDSPVSGGVKGAKAATLSVMCAGDQGLYQESLPVLQSFTAHQFYIGPKPGQAQVMKILNNFLSATALAATSEAVLYGLKHGLAIEQMCDVINVSTGVNSATRDKFPQQVATGQFNAGFSNALMLKDIELYLANCLEINTPVEVGRPIVNQWREFSDADPGVDATRIFSFKQQKDSNS